VWVHKSLTVCNGSVASPPTQHRAAERTFYREKKQGKFCTTHSVSSDNYKILIIRSLSRTIAMELPHRYATH